MGNRNLIIVVVLVVLGFIVVAGINRTHRDETTGERLSNNINEIAEDIGDDIEDGANKIRKDIER